MRKLPNIVSLDEYYQYKTVKDAIAAGYDYWIIVGYGKDGLMIRKTESKNSFVLVPILDI